MLEPPHASNVQVFGINWVGICSEYLLGFIMDCPDFPSSDEIYDAPSVCLEEYIGVLMKLKKKMKPLDVTEVLAGNYSQYCYENCYQHYVDQTDDFNNNCEVSKNLTGLVQSLASFRGISCGETNRTNPEDNDNCYDALTAMLPAEPSPSSPVSDYSCSQNPAAYGSICANFDNDCCFGNQAIMLGQTLMSPLPPCLNKYCKEIAPITDLCGRHINFATGNVQAFTYLNFAAGLPNMYQNISVLTFQSMLSRPLGLLPTQVSFFDFTYFVGGTPVLTNTATSYNGATSGNFSFLVSVVDTTQEQLASIMSTLSSQAYAGTVASMFGQDASAVTVSVVTDRFYPSDQIKTTSSAFSISATASAWIFMFLTAATMFSPLYL